MSIFGIDLGPIDDVTGWITDRAGDVVGGVENLAGGLSGDSEIGRVDYKRRSAFESPEAQRYLEQIRKAEGEQGRFLNEQVRLRALGLAPSAAEMQMRQGQEQALRQQLAMASSARGGAGAQIQARRQAMFNAADIDAEIARRTAILRAQEQERAGAQYLTGLGSVRGQRAQTLGMIAGDEARMQQMEQQARLASAGAQVQMFGAGLNFLGGLGGAAIGAGGGGAPVAGGGSWTPALGATPNFYG